MTAQREPYSKDDFTEVSKLPCKCIVCPDCRGTGTIKYSFDGLREPENCDCSNGVSEICDRCKLLEEMDQGNMEYFERKERAGLP